MRRRVPISTDGHHHDEDDGLPRQAEGEATGTNAPPAADSAPEGAPAAAPAAEPDPRAAELDARVKDLEARLADEHNQYLRTLADFQNFRRRTEEQVRERTQFANQEIVTGLLPILDNLERALQAAETSRNFEALMGGVALTLRQLLDYLVKNGVQPIDAVGREFDPNVHEAVLRVEDSGHPENTVVEELQRGYTMHSRVLRPSMVKVARHS